MDGLGDLGGLVRPGGGFEDDAVLDESSFEPSWSCCDKDEGRIRRCRNGAHGRVVCWSFFGGLSVMVLINWYRRILLVSAFLFRRSFVPMDSESAQDQIC